MAGVKPLVLRLINHLDLKGISDPAYLLSKLREIYTVLEDVHSVGSATELQEAIDAIGDGAGTIFIESGVHVITTTIDIDGSGSLLIYGHGNNTVFEPIDGVSVFNITDVESCIIKALRIDASAYTGATQSVIVNEISNKVVSFENVNIIGNNAGIGIELQSDNCMVRACNLSFLQDGIYINNSNRNIIIQNIIQSNVRYGINVNTSLYSSINGNTYNLNLMGINVLNSANNSISNNISNQNTENGIYIHGSSYNTLSGNTCENNDSNTVGNTAGMYITNNSNFNTISGNSLNNNNNLGIGDGFGLIIATDTCDENVVASNNWNGNDIDVMDIGVGTTLEYYVQNVDELQDALNSIGSGAGIININSSFNVSATIVIDKNGSYLIEGEGDNTVLTTVGDISCFNIDIARQVVFKNFKIDASSLTSNKKIIDVNENNNNLTVFDNITIVGNGTHGYGIELSSNNCRINNCNINNVNIGINILSTDNILQGNKTLNCNVNGIQISANNNMLNTNTCSNNVIGIYLNTANNNLIIGNYCESNTQWGISLNDSNYNSIPNNYYINNDGNSANPIGGIGIDGDSDNNQLLGNTSIDNNNAGAEDGYGIYLGVGTDNNHLLANWLSGNDDNQKDLGNNTTFSIAGHLHDGETLQLDGINSDGGVFDFLTTGQVNFNKNVLVPNLITAGKVDDVDVSVLKTAHDNLKTDVDGFPDRLKNLTPAEVQQLENIDLKTISNAQWGYLGFLNQNLRTTDDVSHNKVSLTAGNVVVGTVQLTDAIWKQLANIGVITISAAQWGYLGDLDQALTQASTPTFAGLTMTGNIAMGANKITGLAAPNANGEALRFQNISNLVYDGVLWNGITDVAPSKNAVRDVIDFLVTCLMYKGTWTPNGYPAAPVVGDYWICDADGYVAADAPTPERWYEVGDWVLWNGVIWNQLRNSFGDNVISVAPDDPIQLAIDEIESIGSGVISLLAGTHNLTAPLTINDVNVNILIRGAGESTIIDLNGDRTAFIITNAKSCILREFKIDANDLTTADEEIIDITEANNNPVVVERITITGDGVNGHGIEINSDNCKVEGCTIDNVKYGILCYGNDNTIQENNVNSCNTDGIAILGDNNSLYDNESDNNNQNGIRLNTGSYNQVNGNYIQGNAQNGIYLTGSDYNAINDNYCIGNDSNTANPQGGIVIDADSDNNAVISNTSINNNNAGAGKGYGILINNANCIDNKIKDNNCSGNDIQYWDIGINTDLIYRCSTEEEIQDALDSIAAKSGTIIILPIAGGIQLSATININGGGFYIIEGSGIGSLIDCAGDRTAFNITSAKSGTTLKNFKIDATDLTIDSKEIINITEGSDNHIVVDSITIIGNGSDGHGIEINSDGVLVSNCNVSSVYYGIALQEYANYCIIEGNICIDSVGGIYLNKATLNVISGNNCYGNTANGIEISTDANDNSISGNISENNHRGITLGSCEHNTATGNICNNNDLDGIYLYLGDNNSLVGNTCNKNGQFGIQAYSTLYNTITGNICNENIKKGIFLLAHVAIASKYNTITGNTCNRNNLNSGSSGGGIFLSDTDYNVISGNNCSKNINVGAGTGYGINIDVLSNKNLISGNVYEGNDINYLDNGVGTRLFGDDTAYGVGWLNDLGTATKNAIYNAIETALVPKGLYGENLTERSTGSTSYVKLKELEAIVPSKHMLISWEHKRGTGVYACRSSIYKNGVFLWGDVRNLTTNYVLSMYEYTGEIAEGDLIQIYGRTEGGDSTMYVKNLLIRAWKPNLSY